MLDERASTELRVSTPVARLLGEEPPALRVMPEAQGLIEHDSLAHVDVEAALRYHYS